MSIRRLAILLLILLVLLPQTARAKGAFTRVLLTDPDSGVVLNMTDITALHHFFIFDWQYGQVDEPSITTKGYELRRGSLVDGQFVPFDLVIYYPGNPGYIYYAGLLDYNGNLCTWCSAYDKRWYRVNPDVAAELQAMLTQVPQRALLMRVVNSLMDVLGGLPR